MDQPALTINQHRIIVPFPPDGPGSNLTHTTSETLLSICKRYDLVYNITIEPLSYLLKKNLLMVQTENLLLLEVEETQDASKKELRILHVFVLLLVGIKFKALCILASTLSHTLLKK